MVFRGGQLIFLENFLAGDFAFELAEVCAVNYRQNRHFIYVTQCGFERQIWIEKG